MSIYNAIAQGSNIGAGINAFAQNQYMVNQDRELKAERQEQNAFARQQRQAETMRQIFMDAVQMGPDAGFAYLSEMSPRFGVQPPDERVREMIAQASQGMIPQGAQRPASLQEWEAWRQMTPEQRQEFLLIKRAAPMVNMGGGGVAFGNPIDSSLSTVVPPEVATERDATSAGAVESAKQGAQISAIPSRTIAEIKADFDRFAAEQQKAGMADLGQATANAESAMSVIEGLRNHPGLDYLVGPASVVPIIPGTPQADAFAFVEQIQGKAFLEAFATLKGGGQITEVEGAKATAAIARLNRAQSKQAFVQALNELYSIAQKGLERAQKKASGPAVRVQGVESMPSDSPMSDDDYNERVRRALEGQ